MTGNEKKLLQLMDGSSQYFVIPVYQRNYDWKKENCKQLFDDLLKVIQLKRKNHFFGSIVSVFNDEGHDTEFLIIDGQQRLTTVSLILLAMVNLMRAGQITPNKGNLADLIYESYLIDKWNDGATQMKLKPIKGDEKAFKALFTGDPAEYIKGSNLTENYHYFSSRILQCADYITPDQLYDAIMRLEIIHIQLKESDNPQLIFESLNSTGLALNEGDKIRNYVLMNQPSKKQEQFYDKYWNPIEECTGYQVDYFVRDYLSLKTQVTPSFGNIYKDFKTFVEDASLDTEELLKDLLKYAKIYQKLLKATTSDGVINESIFRLNRLETSVTRPFLMVVLQMVDDGQLPVKDAREIFRIVESYLFRRTICETPTNALNKVFVSLNKEITSLEGNTDSYLERFKYVLNHKQGSACFPSDEEFVQSFTERQIYRMNAKAKIYTLAMFENFDTKETKDIFDKCEKEIYTIEHIMPQHLSELWIKELGDDYKEIHAVWLHRIANLTLTAYNSKYSNNTFIQKRDDPNGFKKSGIRLNQWIAENNQWTLKELLARNDQLMSLALKIWVKPDSTFAPKEIVRDALALDDDPSLMTGRHIVSFSYKNHEQPVKAWVDMFVAMVKHLHTQDPTIINQIADGVLSSTLSIYVSREAQSGNFMLEDGLYFTYAGSTWSKMSVLNRLFQHFDAVPSDLVFYLRNESTDKPVDVTKAMEKAVTDDEDTLGKAAEILN
ncbi:MAG: DUF262 domain-containing protein [Clostridia bacterium]|nr:DUF262 domain-containing protein [Clostridia bacterium]